MAAEHEQPTPSPSGGEEAMRPEPTAPPAAPPPASGPAKVAVLPKTRMSWSRRIEKLILSIFCLEVGGFLLVFPWLPYWSDNYFFSFAEQLQPLFLSPYFRGAISGLGALNLYLAVVESIDFLGSFLDS